MYVIYLYLYDVSPKGSLPMKRIIRHLIKQQRFPKSTVILADEAQLLLLLCVCVCVGQLLQSVVQSVHPT